jgi:hypothetical protein
MLRNSKNAVKTSLLVATAVTPAAGGAAKMGVLGSE